MVSLDDKITSDIKKCICVGKMKGLLAKKHTIGPYIAERSSRLTRTLSLIKFGHDRQIPIPLNYAQVRETVTPKRPIILRLKDRPTY